MSTELLNLAQRREALEKGLQQFIHGTLLDSALRHWEQQYSMKPSFVLNRFLNDICTTEELRFYRKDMLKQVLYELSTLEKQELLRVEKPQEQEQRRVVASASEGAAVLPQGGSSLACASCSSSRPRHIHVPLDPPCGRTASFGALGALLRSSLKVTGFRPAPERR